MKTRISPIAGLLVLTLSLLSTSAMAGLIKSGDKLGYDQNTNLMWYSGFDLYGSFDNLNPILARLPRTTTIDSKRVLLDWSLAKVAQINTINFLDEATFSFFAQNEASYSDSHHAYMFFGFSGDLQTIDYAGDGPGLVDTTLGVNRSVLKLDDGTLCWYDDYAPSWVGSRCGNTNYLFDPNNAGPSDYRIPVDYAGNGPFWLTADVRFIHSVPEPSSLLLLLGGLLGLAALRKKSG